MARVNHKTQDFEGFVLPGLGLRTTMSLKRAAKFEFKDVVKHVVRLNRMAVQDDALYGFQIWTIDVY